MKCLTWFSGDDHRIDIHSSWLRVKKVYHDGRLVSQRNSFFGSKHQFLVAENSREVSYEIIISPIWPAGAGVDIYRDGKAQLLS